MELKQVEAFVKVIQHKSFTKAAQEMFLTQPTISAHISSLERELGVKLIVRTTKEVSLSKVGRTFFQYATQMLELREKSIDAVKNFESDMFANITIGVSNLTMTCFFQRLIDEFLDNNPNFTFDTVYENSTTIIEQVIKQQIEIGLVSMSIPTKKCLFESFATDKLVLIAPNITQYVTIGKAIGKLLSEPFISREQGSGTRRKIEYLLREIGYEPSRLNIVDEYKDSESIIKAVIRGEGISIISNCVAQASPQNSRFLTFPIGKPTQSHNLFLVTNKAEDLSPAATKFYNFVLHSGNSIY